MKVYDLFTKHNIPYPSSGIDVRYEGIKIMSTSIGWMTNISNPKNLYTPFYAMGEIDIGIILNADIDITRQLRDPLGPIIPENRMTEREIIDEILKEYATCTFIKTEINKSKNIILEDWFDPS